MLKQHKKETTHFRNVDLLAGWLASEKKFCNIV